MRSHPPGESIALLKIFITHFDTSMTGYGPARTTILTISTQDEPAHPSSDQQGSLFQHRNSRCSTQVHISSKARLQTQMLRHQLTVHIGHVHVEVARQHSVNSRCSDSDILYSSTRCFESQTERTHATQPSHTTLADSNNGYRCHYPPLSHAGERAVSRGGLSYSSRPRIIGRVPVNPPRASMVRWATSERPRTFRKSAHETIVP